VNLRRASSVAFVSFMFAMGGGLATGHASDDLLTPVEAPWTQSVTFSLSNLAGEKRTLEDFSGRWEATICGRRPISARPVVTSHSN